MSQSPPLTPSQSLPNTSSPSTPSRVPPPGPSQSKIPLEVDLTISPPAPPLPAPMTTRTLRPRAVAANSPTPSSRSRIRAGGSRSGSTNVGSSATSSRSGSVLSERGRAVGKAREAGLSRERGGGVPLGEFGRGRGSQSASTSAVGSRVPSLTREGPSASVETGERVGINDPDHGTGTAYGLGSTTLGMKRREGQNEDEDEGDRDVVGDMLDEDDALQASAEAERSGERREGKKARAEEESEGISLSTDLGEGSSSLGGGVGMSGSENVSFDDFPRIYDFHTGWTLSSPPPSHPDTPVARPAPGPSTDVNPSVSSAPFVPSNLPAFVEGSSGSSSAPATIIQNGTQSTVQTRRESDGQTQMPTVISSPSSFSVPLHSLPRRRSSRLSASPAEAGPSRLGLMSTSPDFLEPRNVRRKFVPGTNFLTVGPTTPSISGASTPNPFTEGSSTPPMMMDGFNGESSSNRMGMDAGVGTASGSGMDMGMSSSGLTMGMEEDSPMAPLAGPSSNRARTDHVSVRARGRGRGRGSRRRGEAGRSSLGMNVAIGSGSGSGSGVASGSGSRHRRGGIVDSDDEVIELPDPGLGFDSPIVSSSTAPHEHASTSSVPTKRPRPSASSQPGTSQPSASSSQSRLPNPSTMSNPKAKTKSHTQSRPREPTPAAESLLSSYACPICFSPPINATLTPCGHIMCGECLFTAVGVAVGRTGAVGLGARCPVCRANLPGWDGRGGGVIGLKARVLISL
ncbi:uncharacterized protein STEHIDRAFT_136703 [Stereum hirsutum FP-91666 SS1]|uniref:uncharacterized protein n=1 Tax=Stereum hirsutum (strain FP-91666) TaxID=721885 RepID=UPI000440B8E1|nr:uncharacterized protein STEHIDRAFT_136703 [Stereum hirsutum FP-91666 SS1]EIM90662.1 hypothetical protein STEHIDRAFT_136703 [Stereum hirsutum FP-91666 SS1]